MERSVVEVDESQAPGISLMRLVICLVSRSVVKGIFFQAQPKLEDDSGKYMV